ncbi:uncharacterized protein LOC143210125 isoform X12 [Lasioglossum baleicum]|uniref:uncharacterized protein LOC143210125 isoform X12 n=1 Tax=Lasioglossum baleicum TaxID=434251 RepID=UPI003FCDA16C
MSPNIKKGACTDYIQVAHESPQRTSHGETRSGNKHVCGTIRGPSLARHFGGMVLWATILFLQGANFVGSVTGIPGVPENITVMFLNPTSVRVSWSTSQVEQVEKYDVTYKPTDARCFITKLHVSSQNNDRKHNDSYRVVAVVAGNSEAITLSGLKADTQYQLTVTATRAGVKYRSRPIVFRTLEPPRTSPQQDAAVTGGPLPPPPPSSQHPQPYTQHLHWSNHHVDSLDSGPGLGWPRTSRPRVNSAIDVAGFLSQEFLRRHGSTSKLCRKVRSADNLPLASTNRPDQRNSKEDGIDGDKESFLKPTPEEKSEDSKLKRQTTCKGGPKENHQLQSSRDSPIASSSSFVGRRFGGWRASGSHEYAPVRQPASMDERYYRPSCVIDARPPCHHHSHRRVDHSKSCDYARSTPESSIDVQHFGLPILSVSEPSPPDENDRVDEYL